jgi:N,N'-diacetyllegionaminate synthase
MQTDWFKRGVVMRNILIIAEAGVNHNGDMALAKQMIDAASAAGADLVKFQTFHPESLVSRFAQKADYQKQTTDAAETQLSMLQKLELKPEDHQELITYCGAKKIGFLSTPFDFKSIDFLESIAIPLWKIPSGEITNLPYLIKIAKTGKDVILSSGMSDLEEIRDAITTLRDHGAGKITVLHCNTEYPTPYGDDTLRAMETIRRELGVEVGYSDHTPGIEIPIAAAALGATVIEKHFTLDKNMDGPDHKASLEPDELAAMVKAIRNVEKAMGDGVKRPSASERKNIVIARKSIVATRDIKAGEPFNEDNITTKRPGNGISPMRWFDVLGQMAVRDFKEDELIEL